MKYSYALLLVVIVASSLVSDSHAQVVSELIPEGCLEPKFTGLCEALFRRYHYNRETQSCELFDFGGCDANRNNFMTKEECERSCIHFAKSKL